MKKTILLTFILCFGSILLMAQGGSWHPPETGSKWDKSYNKRVKNTAFEVKDGKITELFDKKYQQFIFSESMINQSEYGERQFLIVNKNTGEVVFSQQLESGKINTVVINLSAIRKLYPDKEVLKQQMFIITERADDITEQSPAAFRFN